MATTTNYSFPTPDDTALVKDGASAIRSLGSAVDTTVKALNPSTTLGDIEYRSSTADTNTRLGIGTTGQLLTVVGGVPAWAAAPASSPTSAVATTGGEQSTTSTSYTDLATTTAVTLTTGTKALVIVTSYMFSGDNPCGMFMDYAVSGATTRAASDSTAFRTQRSSADVRVRASSVSRITVTAGSNTFTAKYKVSAGTGFISDREIFVMDLGS
jgi:hypothetical protein